MPRLLMPGLPDDGKEEDNRSKENGIDNER
jgi:hypothetical protein